MSEGSTGELRRRWKAIEPELKTIAVEAGQTIRAERPTGRAVDAALASLARVSEAAGLEGRIDLLDTLGEGAMGIVHLGTQAALGRPVAVKALKAKVDDPDATLTLLQEAWITGSLEHPNIVPLYDLGLDSHRRPVIVMKRIVGESWRALLDDGAGVARRFGEHDLLEWNLGVFMQVCNAVHFAHAHGILHLDLKPANVMIGGFGEVYLVDWGVAVSMAPDPQGRFPLASDVTLVRGTPAYIAPEMVAGEGDTFSERTDVFLLGAVLYELIAGRPPFVGGTTLAVLYQAATTSPEPPEAAPEELVALVRKATARDPEERFASADELRRGVQDFLHHRDSTRLAEQADARAQELRQLAEGAADPSDPELQERIGSLFSAARFGFQQALESWEGNAFARAGLRQLLLGALMFELSRGEAQSAAALAAELGELPPELRARLDAALAARASEQDRAARFDELSADVDPSRGIRTRVFVTVVLALSWVAVPLAAALLPDAPLSRSYPGWVATAFLLLLLAAGLGAWGRESLSLTRINRDIGKMLVSLLALQAAMIAAAGYIGLPLEQLPVFLLVLWSSVLTNIVINIERRFVWSLAVFLVGLVVAVFVPGARLYCLAAVNAGFLVNTVVIWRPGSLRR
jgi:eukaryotic-like serine/threonine-protein kinase